METSREIEQYRTDIEPKIDFQQWASIKTLQFTALSGGLNEKFTQ